MVRHLHEEHARENRIVFMFLCVCAIVILLKHTETPTRYDKYYVPLHMEYYVHDFQWNILSKQLVFHVPNYYKRSPH
jgi:hypothetical protein